MNKYEILSVNQDEAFFLGSIINLFDQGSEINLFLNKDIEKPTRKTFDGFFTVIGLIKSKRVALCFNDFRSSGSSFGTENSLRVASFLEYLEKNKIPLIYIANSAGIRIQDGRNVFKNSFSLIPKIKSFAKDNLYIAYCEGQCLGISALLYSLADYRIAIKEKAVFNLTGQEVFKMFFGEKVNFFESCSAENMLYKNQLVQEMVNDRESGLKLIRDIFSEFNGVMKIPNSDSVIENTDWLKTQSIEFFSEIGKSLKIYLKQTNKGSIGFFYNPYNKPNMMSVKDIKKFRFGLQLFKKLKVPVITLIDTAGGDPRISENDLNIAGHIYDLASDIIDYPFYKRGVVIGRCFGGTSILSIPVFFGGDKTLLLKDARIGIMDNNIIKKLLSNARPLLEIWKKNNKSEDEQYADFVEQGLIEELIEPRDMFSKILEGIK